MPDSTPSSTRVLITGANGLVGNIVYAHLASLPAHYSPFGTARGHEPSPRINSAFHQIPDERLHLADLSDFAAVEHVVDGMDVIVHMAANANSNAKWDSVLRDNIVATHNVFEAARLAGVKRVIFASTNQVIFGYRAEEPYKSLFEGRVDDVDLNTYRPITHTQPTRPPNDYAASKVHGEALAYHYAHTYGLSCIALRIGWVTGDDQVPNWPGLSGRMLWCSQRDIVQLVRRCIDAPPSLRFDVFFGHSRNRYNLVDIQHSINVLGYAPQDGAD